MKQSLLIGWFSRALSIACSIVVIPIIISVVGETGYAAYATIMSFSVWLSLLSFGLPITFQNYFSQLRNSQRKLDKLESLFNGSIVLLILVGTPCIFLLAFSAYPFFAEKFSSIQRSSLALSLCILYISSISQIFVNLQYARHQPFWPNIYPILYSLTILPLALILKNLNFQGYHYTIPILFLPLLVAPAHAALKSIQFAKPAFSISSILGFIKQSKHNFIFAIFSAATLSIDSFIMLFTLSSREIILYTLTNKIFMSIFVFVNVIIQNQWTPLADLLHQSRPKEARLLLVKVVKQTLSLGLGLGLPLMLASPFLLALLSDHKITRVSLILPLFALAYLLVRVWTDTFAMFLLCFDQSMFINKFVPLQAVISVIFQVLLGRAYGPLGIFAGMIISFLATVSWLLPARSLVILRDLRGRL